MHHLKILWCISSALIGCCCSVVFLELLINQDSECGNLVTFSSFLFITVEGFVTVSWFGSCQPTVPVTEWTKLILIYFLVNVINNWVLGFNIAMPLHMVYKSGSLVASMLTGMWVLDKRYSVSKYVSVMMVTVGVATCTVASGLAVAKEQSNLTDWTVGIILLTISLFMSARMGVYQEQIYTKWGSHHKEALFYTHCLPLPGFLLLGPNIWKHFVVAVNSTSVNLHFTSVPIMLLYLMGNILSQYVCASSIFRLSSLCSSLTVTLVLTLRKLLSILISIWFFQNNFTPTHWYGVILVFAGTLLYMKRGPAKQKAS